MGFLKKVLVFAFLFMLLIYILQQVFLEVTWGKKKLCATKIIGWSFILL
jgi:hypothetical protein